MPIISPSLSRRVMLGGRLTDHKSTSSAGVYCRVIVNKPKKNKTARRKAIEEPCKITCRQKGQNFNPRQIRLPIGFKACPKTHPTDFTPAHKSNKRDFVIAATCDRSDMLFGFLDMLLQGFSCSFFSTSLASFSTKAGIFAALPAF